MSPPYLFRIDEITEHADAIAHYDKHGFWEPSTEPRANIWQGGGVSGTWWYCNGQRIYSIGTQAPAGAQHYGTCSMYYTAGRGILILSKDATTLKKGDWESWHPLRFYHSPTDYSSYLSTAGQHPALRVQRPNQNWPNLLLPSINHTDRTDVQQPYGGLTGELPIFLGLLAHSTHATWLATALPTTFANGQWLEHQYGQPRTDRRGVVVKVYTSPWNPDISTAEELQAYETGSLGKYYN